MAESVQPTPTEPRTCRACAAALGVMTTWALLWFWLLLTEIFLPGRMHANEFVAISKLGDIARAETAFRDGDKAGNGKHDYGTLAQLSQAKLVDAFLGAGKMQGYLCEVAPSPTSPETSWMATATPIAPKGSPNVDKEYGPTGSRWFVTNQQGVVFESREGPFAITPDCAIPAQARPLNSTEPMQWLGAVTIGFVPAVVLAVMLARKLR
jgi:hypothetical protein